MPEPAFWALFGSAATIILQRPFRWLRAHEREATPEEWQRARAELKRMRAQ